MEAILACHPARSTEWLDYHPKSCELWRIRTGPIKNLFVFFFFDNFQTFEKITFEKIMNSAFEENQVWHNQMMKSCHVLEAGAQYEYGVEDWYVWPV